MNEVFQIFKDHWLGYLAVLLLLYVAWRLWRNGDLQGPRTTIRLGLLAVVVTFFLGGLLGWSSGHRYLDWVAGCVLAFLSVYFLSLIVDCGPIDMLAGLIGALIFSDGAFAQRFIPPKKLPNVTLLRHWRQHGRVRFAFRTARRHLVPERRAFPVWLFAAETAALYLKDLPKAEQIICRLCRCPEFSEDERIFACGELKGWAARFGVHLELSQSTSTRGTVKRDLLKEAARLRHAGLYDEARGLLELVLQREPDNLAAGLMLMQVLAQDQQKLEKAGLVLKTLRERRFTSTAFLEFAQRSLDEWQDAKSERPVHRRSWWARLLCQKPSPPPMSNRIKLEGLAFRGLSDPAAKNFSRNGRSVGDLLGEGRFGTARAEAEARVKAQPYEFESWHDLLTILTGHVGSLNRAKAVVKQVEQNPDFTAAQKAQATELLRLSEAASYQRANY